MNPSLEAAPEAGKGVARSRGCKRSRPKLSPQSRYDPREARSLAEQLDQHVPALFLAPHRVET